jgi:dTDP-4-dehydrorhamnose 3,5-epimerase
MLATKLGARPCAPDPSVPTPPQSKMTIRTTSIEGLLVVESQRFDDDRGFFRESWRWSELTEALGREPRLRQNNHSRSRAGVLRGFHMEAWDKLLYVPRGTATVAVGDPRPDSSTFGTAETFVLGDPPGHHVRLFVARGLCNAFYCHTETDYLNEVSEEFDPRERQGIRWDDPTFAVDWPDREPVISAWDDSLPYLTDLVSGTVGAALDAT